MEHIELLIRKIGLFLGSHIESAPSTSEIYFKKVVFTLDQN